MLSKQHECQYSQTLANGILYVVLLKTYLLTEAYLIAEKYPCPQDMPKSTPKPSKSSDKNNDIVPIAVGCALAGLVLIVLIAYIIGRRKSHRGYEKV